MEEWRFFIVDDTVYYGIFTQAVEQDHPTKDITVYSVDSITPLQSIWYVSIDFMHSLQLMFLKRDEYKDLSMTDLAEVFNPEVHLQQNKGKEELHRYIFTTLQALQNLEDRQMMSVPNTIFMRMAISVIRNEEENTYNFFINELTRSTSAARFVGWAGVKGKQLLLDFGLALRKHALITKSTL